MHRAAFFFTHHVSCLPFVLCFYSHTPPPPMNKQPESAPGLPPLGGERAWALDVHFFVSAEGAITVDDGTDMDGARASPRHEQHFMEELARATHVEEQVMMITLLHSAFLFGMSTRVGVCARAVFCSIHEAFTTWCFLEYETISRALRLRLVQFLFNAYSPPSKTFANS